MKMFADRMKSEIPLTILFLILSFLSNGCAVYKPDKNNYDKIYENIALAFRSNVESNIIGSVNITTNEMSIKRLCESHDVRHPDVLFKEERTYDTPEKQRELFKSYIIARTLMFIDQIKYFRLVGNDKKPPLDYVSTASEHIGNIRRYIREYHDMNDEDDIEDLAAKTKMEWNEYKYLVFIDPPPATSRLDRVLLPWEVDVVNTCMRVFELEEKNKTSSSNAVIPK